MSKILNPKISQNTLAKKRTAADQILLVLVLILVDWTKVFTLSDLDITLTMSLAVLNHIYSISRDQINKILVFLWWTGIPLPSSWYKCHEGNHNWPHAWPQYMISQCTSFSKLSYLGSRTTMIKITWFHNIVSTIKIIFYLTNRVDWVVLTKPRINQFLQICAGVGLIHYVLKLYKIY